MAVAHDKDWSSTATGTITLTTPTGGVAAGNAVVLTINNRNGLPSAVTDSVGGNTWTLLTSDTGQSQFAIYGSLLTNALPASSTITVTLGSGFGEAVASSFSGVSSITPLDSAHAADTLHTTHTVATAGGGSTTVGDLVVAGFGAKATLTFTAGTGYTLSGTVSNSTSTVASEWALSTATGNQTATITSASGSVSMGIIVLGAAGGGGAIQTLTPDTINSTATVTASAVRDRALQATVASTAAVTDSVVRTRALAATVNSTGTVADSIVRTRALTPSQMTALTTVSAALATNANPNPTSEGDQQIPKVTLATGHL